MKAIKLLLIIFLVVPFILNAQNKYVGAKMCKMCHQSDKQGKQFDIWQKSKHAEAYKTLSNAKSAEIAKAKGLKKAANESPECLECHAITADAKLTADGVQCELCHGAGSAYKTMPIMKDQAKAIAAGLTDFKDKGAIEKKCKTCHNEKSPTHKGFKLEEMWAKIKHPIPKG
ncbi:MAG: multiheme c-type cytochrome [Ignavibacteriales bacterium]|nr:multiheme c-type cytochrome [Ignavibacteriales bacterium]